MAFTRKSIYMHFSGAERLIGKVRIRTDTGFDVHYILLPLAILVQLFALASESMAVGGLSGSKLVVPETSTVSKGRIEVEPFFSLEFVDDDNDTVRYGGGLRLTPGLLENLEAGVNINYLDVEDSGLISAETNFGDIESGFKLRFIDQEVGLPFSLAYQAGVTFPAGKGAEWIVEPGGLILTKEFTEKFSMDADFVFGLIEHGSWSFTADAGFGCYLNSWFQPVIEAAYAYEDPDNKPGIWVLNVSAGFTADVSDWLTIVLGVTPDLHTENTEKEVVVTSAFTFTF
jgi:hypothetical protein